MAFDPMSGSSGRVRRASVAFSAASDLITAGEVVAAAAGLAADSALTGWKVSVSVESGKVITFESPGNSQGVLAAQPLRGGIASIRVSLSGVYDKDAAGNIAARYDYGSLIVADLIFHKGTTHGYKSVPMKVVSVDTGSQANANPAEFSVTCDVIGHLPAPT